jgi:hypothetical protein
MHSMRTLRTLAFALAALALLSAAPAGAQAALLMEEPYGFFGALNPTGHTALYFRHICAETPIKLRRCQTGEMGVVLSRYQGIANYDWVAIPLVPYLYAVEDASGVPAHADKAIVWKLRSRYHEAHLLGLGEIPVGNIYHGGWTELVGAAYERRIYAFRFVTTAAQDDVLIARLNGVPNDSHFDLLWNNCSDWARKVLNTFFPGTFPRSVFPDAGMTTPKQIAFKLEHYGRQHPEAQLSVFVIPQVPGYRRHSGSNKNVTQSLATTAYAVPIALFNPYIAGGLAVDYLVRGRGRLVPRETTTLSPGTLSLLAQPSQLAANAFSLTAASPAPENAASVGRQATRAAIVDLADPGEAPIAHSGLLEINASHE